jgi:hypothetical protein
METILEKEQYIILYRVSYLSLFSAVYAFYRAHYHLAIVPGSVFLSSIHYWKKPDYSYRRYLDMTVVKSAVIYQHYMAYNAEYANMYYTILYIAMLSYPIGLYYYNKKDYWKSTYAHMMLHIMANIGNIVLYSGNI